MLIMSHLAFRLRLLILVSLLSFGTRTVADEPAAATEQQLDFVRTKVLPLLEARCFECHTERKEAHGSLQLSSRKAMLHGGDSGPVIVPGKPNESLMIAAIRYENFEMPPRTRMPKEEVSILEQWIADGAHWPNDLDAEPAPAEPTFPLQARRKSHWAWQPIADPAAPVVKSVDWCKTPADHFILSKLEDRKLTPAADADRYTLLRRLYFDIIGLPPSIAEIEAFVADKSDDDTAIAKVVGELLASPHFGERWGRHWLDLVRYAETLGHEFDYPLHNAWQYRDYVIRAFNADVPYNDFVREHVAGDLLAAPRRNPETQINESVIATGFWFLNEGKHAPVDVRAEEAAMVDNQIDVFSKTFLGMTVACARCHDHKFDAIATKDYYALAGFLQSSRRETAWLDQHHAIAERVEQLQQTSSKAQTLVAENAVSAESTQQIRNCVLAALEVIQGTAADVETAAAAHACNPVLLQRWADALRLEQQASPASALSLPARIAQMKPETKLADVFREWRRSVASASNAGKADNNTTSFADLQNGIPADWLTTGEAFKSNHVDGQPDLHWSNSGLRMNAEGGVSSATRSTELRGTLTSPTFELKHPEILVRVAGEGSRMRLVIDGYIMFEFNGLLFNGANQAIETAGEFRWLRFAGDIHRYQGHRAHLEFLDEGNGWMIVQEVRFANTAGANPAASTATPLNQQLAAEPDATAANTEQLLDAWLVAMTSHSDFATADLFNAGLLHGLGQNAVWEQVIAEWKQQATGVPAPMAVIAITEGSPENERVFIRGNHRNLGEEAPRSILSALRKDVAQNIETGSGRLLLAEHLVAGDNPLTTRVVVNRIWHHLFGTGLVESTDNFGVLGKLPSHPELLDHLAVQFQKDGWSIKKMIRTLASSRTYRLSSDRLASAEEVDPGNQLLHHARIRRLQGEAVRDSILTVSGRLDRQRFGAPVPVHLTEFMQGRGRPGNSGPLDGAGRRSIYIAVNRNFLSPFMLAFDVPAPVTTTGRRTSSNVPAQALIMLNNEFVNQQADVWATKLLASGQASSAELIGTAWFQLFGRPAAADELQPLLDFVEAPDSKKSLLSKDSLTQICHVLLNSKEFLFLR